jgi:hypothetical protein
LGVLRSAPNFFCMAARNSLFLGLSMLVKYEPEMKMPSASGPMLLAVPSSTARLP